jgi:NAD dependent epimerase/dehydratase family enzyme
MMASLRRHLKIRIGLPNPEWLLEAGAFLLRNETELILKSSKVYPEKLLKAGFEFKYPTISDALKSLIKSQ